MNPPVRFGEKAASTGVQRLAAMAALRSQAIMLRAVCGRGMIEKW
jgi:hypothetical protein